MSDVARAVLERGRGLVAGADPSAVAPQLLVWALALGLLLSQAPGSLVVLAAAAAGASTRVLSRRSGRGPVLALVVALALLGGAVAGQARVGHLERSDLAPLLGHHHRGEATLLEGPQQGRFDATALARLDGEPVLLRLRSAVTGAGARPRPEPTAGDAALRPGRRIVVSGVLRAPGRLGSHRQAHADWRVDHLEVVGRRGGPLGIIDTIRDRAATSFAVAGLPPDVEALLSGMVLGDDHALSPSAREDLRAAGLGHLVAASGANIALLAVLALGLGAVLRLRWRTRLGSVLVLIAVYVPLAGGGPSIQRAGIMGAATVTALLVGRASSRAHVIGLAVVGTLLLDPRAVADPGWQLSFAAVAGIVLAARRWSARLRAAGLPPGAAEATAVTTAATLATAPIAALRFGTLSLVGLPANVLVFPAVAPATWLGAIAAVVGQASTSLGGLVAWVAGVPVGAIAVVARTAAGMQGAAVALDAASAGVVAVVAGSAWLLWRAAPRPGRPPTRGAGVRVLLVPAVAAVVLVGGVAGRASGGLDPPRAFRVTFLDIGQGDATLLQSPDAAVLVDTGPPDGPILRRLREAGVRRLDALVVTHAQADHLGAGAAVLAALPVGVVLDGRDGVPSPLGAQLAAVARDRGVRLVPATAGQTWRIGGLRLVVHAPRALPASAHAGEDPNQRAVVAEVAPAVGSPRVLLPADAESDVLLGLDLRPVDILKVSHHGSADEGLPAVLDRLRPRIAGIEVGRHNTYGHPVPATLETLRRSVPQVVRTDRDGTVRVDLEDGRLVVRRG